jgi:hypothetical protein
MAVHHSDDASIALLGMETQSGGSALNGSIADRSGNVSHSMDRGCVLVGHVDIDVRVVVGRRYANALELLRSDAVSKTAMSFRNLG